MTATKKPSRRSMLASLTASPVLAASAALPAAAATTDAADAHLIALAWRFDALAEAFDRGCESNRPLSEALMDDFGRTEAELLATPATTIEGLLAKARAVCWSRLGDLDWSDDAAADERMMLSIVRDLIRQHAPDLERPGALRRLVEGL